MNAPVKHMAARHDVTWGCRIEAIEQMDRDPLGAAQLEQRLRHVLDFFHSALVP